MGMSASQVRLLTITSRIHSIENEAQRLQNQKMLLGLQSDEAYDKYLEAMDKKEIQYSRFNPETGGFEWEEATFTALIGAGYGFKVKNLTNGVYPSTGAGQVQPGEYYETNDPADIRALLQADATILTEPSVFRELVYNAYVLICNIVQEENNTITYQDSSVATNVGLRERENDTDIALAEAEYEAALRKIDKKEQKYDTDLAAIDQQRSALTTQLDTLKTCIKDNVERTFKIFS